MVEWKKLGDECKVLRGKRLTKSLLDEKAQYPVFHGGIEPLGRYNQYNREANTVMVINVGASAGTVGFCNTKFWSSDGCFCISESDSIISKFLYYYLECKTHYLQSQVRYAGIPTLDNSVIEKLLIPIPSLSEQSRIVSILDTFTASIKNLKEQIAERRKQYEYEREKLLDLEGKEGVEMKTLGEVCVKNQNIKWKSESADKYYDYIDLSSVSIDLNSITETTEINKENAPSRAQQIVKDGDVLLGTTRPTLKRYCQVPLQYDNQICSTGYCVLRAKTECVLSRWIFHNIGNRKFWDYCEIHQQGAGYPCLSNSDAFSYRIPLPSLSEQARIVSILDTFETSIANLEAQLELRQKQYEYYRNQLLTFE